MILRYLWFFRFLAFCNLPRLSESKEKETFEELPLCLIKERYKNVEGGDKFVEDIQKSDCPSFHNHDFHRDFINLDLVS